MASLEEKVKALERLRDRRLARAAAAAAAAAEAAEPDEPGAAAPGEAPAAAAAEAAEEAPCAAIDGLSENALSALTSTCENNGMGGSDAFFCAGHCCEHGLHGCTADAAAAAELYRLAAADGHTAAQWRLGELHEYGRGMERDEAQAARWYRLAAEAGDAQAQSGLALLLEDGRGVPCDYAEAFLWHSAAAEQGNALSQYCLACCLSEGRGTSTDEAEARQWLLRSAAAGFGPAVRAAAATPLAQHTPAGAGTGSSPDDREEGSNHGNEDSMLGLAERIARQLKDLDDADAEAMLDELLADDTSLLDDLDADSADRDSAPFCPPARDVPAA